RYWHKADIQRLAHHVHFEGGADKVNRPPRRMMGAAIAHCSPVMEALQYIFDQDLRAWSPQKASATKPSFRDLVARRERVPLAIRRLRTSRREEARRNNKVTE
ncbi:MAG: hypothetical protein WAL03_07820, partial [Pseudolabrys sp.]